MSTISSPPREIPRLPKRNLWEFADEVFVECPRCHGLAVIRNAEESRLACTSCGYARSKACDGFLLSYMNDPVFGLPLWLRTEVGRNHIVFAYNWRHLEDLEFFLTANWRAYRHRHPSTTARHSYQCRLPQWMHERKNQADLLRALRRIRAKRG